MSQVKAVATWTASVRTTGPAPRRQLLPRVLRRQLRRVRYAVRPPRAKFVYSPEYQKGIVGMPVDPLRADRVLAFLANERLVRQEEISLPQPAALKNVLLAHTVEYVESLPRQDVITEIVGAPVSESEAEQVFELQRLMAGGTIHATRLALGTGCVAVNLGGGYHHAGPTRGMGFCVLNDVAIAIKRLQKSGFEEPILVVDLDLHDGNGTRQAFADDPQVHTFSIHNDHWGDTRAVASTSIALGSDVEDELYLGTLLKALPPVVEAHAPRLVVYLAGGDVAAEDGLGNWRITGEGILVRDRFVVDQVRGCGAALVVVLAGGYGDQAWRHPARFFYWLLTGSAIEPPPTDELDLLRFRQIKNQLNPLHLTQGEEGNSWELTEDDLVGILPGIPRQTRFLGYFSRVGVELVLERFGILQQLRARGFRSPTVQLELDHPLGQTLRIWGDPSRAELLVEVRLARSGRAIEGMEVLIVEWLLLQNPSESFGPERPALPGQTHPGLGMLGEFFGWLVVLAETMGLDGLYFRPSHYHVATFARHYAVFVDPEHEAVFRGLERVIAGVGLDRGSALFEGGEIIDERSGKPVRWEPFPMVLPVSERLKVSVGSAERERAVDEALAELDFRVASEAPVSG